MDGQGFESSCGFPLGLSLKSESLAARGTKTPRKAGGSSGVGAEGPTPAGKNRFQMVRRLPFSRRTRSPLRAATGAGLGCRCARPVVETHGDLELSFAAHILFPPDGGEAPPTATGDGRQVCGPATAHLVAQGPPRRRRRWRPGHCLRPWFRRTASTVPHLRQAWGRLGCGPGLAGDRAGAARDDVDPRIVVGDPAGAAVVAPVVVRTWRSGSESRAGFIRGAPGLAAGRGAVAGRRWQRRRGRQGRPPPGPWRPGGRAPALRVGIRPVKWGRRQAVTGPEPAAMRDEGWVFLLRVSWCDSSLASLLWHCTITQHQGAGTHLVAVPETKSYNWLQSAPAATAIQAVVDAWKPAVAQAGAQAETGAVEQYPAVVGGDGEVAADFVGVEADHLAHHEDLRRRLRQAMQAGLEDLPELAVVQRLSGFPQSAGLVSSIQWSVLSNQESMSAWSSSWLEMAT